MREWFGRCHHLRSRATDRERPIETLGMPLRSPVVFFLTPTHQDLVPYEDEVTFPPNPDLARVCKSQEYKNFVDSINREYQVTITPMVRAPAAGQNIELVEGFKLNCLQSAKESTTTVKEMLDQLFITHNIHMYPVAPTRVHKRGDSFADAFPHFDSKLLSHPRTRGGTCLQSHPSLFRH